MKANFLQNINLEWLIQGHLTKNEALGLVSQTEQSMPQFSRIEILPQQKLQIVKLRPTYYYEFRAENPKTSKNSGCMTVFQICPDSDMKTNAIAHILASMLNGPAFNYLRTD